MSTVINTNLASLFAQNSLSNAQTNLATSVQRLSSGLRINSAKDDAAGLAIAQNMQSQLNGTNQSIQNLSNATNLLQTADTSLSTIQDMLLRMKQLATQGYDGSLNATQMQDVVQQMNELRTEVNQTAQRTQFNGINLIASGSSVDRVNAGVYSGQYLTQVGANLIDAGSFNDYSLSSGTNNLSVYSTEEDISYTIGLSNDDLVRQNPGKYTFRAVGDQLTLSYTGSDNVPKQQTITIEPAPYDAAQAKEHKQTLSFDKFGITMNLTTTAAAGGPTVLASNIAATFDGKTFGVSGQASKITDIQLSGAAAGSYQFSANGSSTTSTFNDTVAFVQGDGTTAAHQSIQFTAMNIGDSLLFDGLTFVASKDLTAQEVANNFTNTTLTNGTISGGTMSGSRTHTTSAYTFTASGGVLSMVANTLTAGKAAITAKTLTQFDNTLTLDWTDTDNVQHSQSVDLLSANFVAGSDSTISFKDAGISIKLHNFQSQSGAQVADLISGLTDPAAGNDGLLNIVNPGSASLDFQSGPNSNAFITINTLNVQTDSSGQYTGSNLSMMDVGSKMDSLVSLNGQTSTPDWQSAFKDASAAIDAAIDYISTQRSVFGSQMNRLSYITTNLTAQSTNLQSSKSAIMDTNFASETATLTKGQIMQQAATAMLAQANQMPNVILSLLK